MIVTRIAAPRERTAWIYAPILVLTAFFGLFSSQVHAQVMTMTIYACVGQSSLQVRIVPESEECKSTETRVSWNTTGIAGPAGPTGPVGPQGPQGTNGASVTFVESFTGNLHDCPNGGATFATGTGETLIYTYVCNGTNGTSVTSRPMLTTDTRCGSNGGTIFTTESGETYVCNGATGPQGPDGQMSVAAEVAQPNIGAQFSSNTCANVGFVPVAPPAGATAAVVTAKVTVRIQHPSGSLTFDKGFLVFRKENETSCLTGTEVVNREAYKSYFSVSPGDPGGSSNNPHEINVFVQRLIDLPLPPGPSQIYLQGMMTSGATTTSQDSMQDANIIIQYHVK